MRYDVLFAPQAAEDYERLSARERAIVRDAVERHLRYQPQKTGKSRIKRLRSLNRPQYRLRVGDIRVFYDIVEQTVEVLAVIPKAQAAAWLDNVGE